MESRNKYDERFNKVSESRQHNEDIRSKLIEGVLELSEAKRVYSNRHRELTRSQMEISKLKTVNQELKVALMKALIEREELISRKTAFSSRIDRLTQQIEEAQRESSSLLSGDDVDQICDRYSSANQTSILNKIQDAKRKIAALQQSRL